MEVAVTRDKTRSTNRTVSPWLLSGKSVARVGEMIALHVSVRKRMTPSRAVIVARCFENFVSEVNNETSLGCNLISNGVFTSSRIVPSDSISTT